VCWPPCSRLLSFFVTKSPIFPFIFLCFSIFCTEGFYFYSFDYFFWSFLPHILAHSLEQVTNNPFIPLGNFVFTSLLPTPNSQKRNLPHSKCGLKPLPWTCLCRLTKNSPPQRTRPPFHPFTTTNNPWGRECSCYDNWSATSQTSLKFPPPFRGVGSFLSL